MPPLFTLLHVSLLLFKYNPYYYFCFLCLVFSFVRLCFNLLFLLLFLKHFSPSHCCCVLLSFLSSSLSGTIAFHYHALFVVPWLLIVECYYSSLLCTVVGPWLFIIMRCYGSLSTSLTHYFSLAPCCCMLHFFPLVLVVWFLQFGITPDHCLCVSKVK
jgi:hypothetical protein